MSKLEFYLNRIVGYGLYAILLTPLAFWPKALYAFLTPKFLLFQILVEIVFCAWLILQMIDSRNQSCLRRNYIAVALFGFFVVSFVSAIFGVDFTRSVWGIGARMTGLFAELHFLAWFLMLVSYFKNDRKEWNYYLNFSFAVSILVALSAFYQNTQWHLVPGYTIFSNPTFVAPYFLFHFFWGLYQIWNSRSWQKLYYISASALILWTVFLGQIRGAFVGLFLGILFLGVGLIFSNIFKVYSRVLIAVLYAIIVLSLILGWQFRDSKFIEQSYFSRFSHISFEGATVQTRLLTWQTASKGFSLLGVGPENFNYLFNAHYNPRLLMYGGSSFAETWQDKPHNAFIEILTETGIIGGLAYISIWLFVVFYLFDLFKRGEKFLSLILASAFIAYFGAIFFSFDSFGSWFGLFLFLAFLASYNNNTNDTNRHTNDTNKGSRSVNRIFVSSICLFVLLVLLYVNYGIWRANLADADAIRYFGRDSSVGIALFNKSLNYSTPYKSEYQFDLIASVAGAVEKKITINNLENVVNLALDEAEKAVLTHPKNASSYTDMARIYNIFGTIGRDPEILSRAQQFGEKSLELSQNRQETLFYLARTALLQNRSNIAVERAKQAVMTDPTIGMSHWYLGLAYIANNQTNEGAAEIKKALDLGYRPKNDAEKNVIKNLGL